ncbi:hypothetical protein [Massilia psychrophila]|uniref:hypothetical protein n=1 Tax=Massilia psychrophila TaxID=1603353 RepID=UPI00351D4669
MGLNNRAELSHQPTRQREKQMRRFKSPGHAQRFLSAHGPINNVFRCQRNRLLAQQYRHVRTHAFLLWNEVTGVDNILQSSPLISPDPGSSASILRAHLFDSVR